MGEGRSTSSVVRVLRERVLSLWREELPPPHPVLVAGESGIEAVLAGEADAAVIESRAFPAELSEGLEGFVFPRTLWPREGATPALVYRAGDPRMRLLRRVTLPPITIAGAGPGGLASMTRGAARALERADVVLHDELCGTEVLAAASPKARLVPVGKRCGAASVPQGRINDRLLEEAIRGRRVVRLKTGDPCTYGRLGEEVETLEEADLSYRVLPGVGAAPAAAAWLGRPLTERGVSAEVVFSTGRFAGGESNRWPCREGTPPSIAFYMSRRVLEERMARLIEAGLPPETPTAVVEKIGLPDARAVHGTVATIANIADEEGVGTPAVVLVGGSFREPSHLPLHGVRIWLPGEAELAEQQRERLEELGAVCVVLPLIVPEPRSFDVNAIFSRPFDWIAFTSPKGVDYLVDTMKEWGLDIRWLPRRVAAMGDRTVAKLRERGIEPDLIPPEPYRKSLIEALLAQGIEGKRILLPCSAVAPDEVREALAPVAEEVVRVDLYGLRYPEIRAVPNVDAVLFTSPSTVDSARRNGLIDPIRERGILVGGIGPVTSAALRREGLPVDIVPTGFGPDPLARAVLFRLVFGPR